MEFSYGFQVWCISWKRNTPYRCKQKVCGKITYSKLKSGPISQLQCRPVIRGKQMPGAEFLVVGVFFSPPAIFYFTNYKFAVLYFSKRWDVQKNVAKCREVWVNTETDRGRYGGRPEICLPWAAENKSPSPIPAAARSKAWVYGRTLTGIEISIPPRAWMSHFWVLCVGR